MGQRDLLQVLGDQGGRPAHPRSAPCRPAPVVPRSRCGPAGVALAFPGSISTNCMRRDTTCVGSAPSLTEWSMMNITFGVSPCRRGPPARCLACCGGLPSTRSVTDLHQRVGGVQQAGHRCAHARSVSADVLLLEADALVAAQHGSALRRSRPVIWRSRSRMMAGRWQIRSGPVRFWLLAASCWKAWVKNERMKGCGLRASAFSISSP